MKTLYRYILDYMAWLIRLLCVPFIQDAAPFANHNASSMQQAIRPCSAIHKPPLAQKASQQAI